MFRIHTIGFVRNSTVEIENLNTILFRHQFEEDGGAVL